MTVRCWNTNCKRREVVPERPWEAPTLALVDDRGEVTSRDLVDALGLKLPAAAMRLKTLRDEGILRRRQVDPVRGGKLFAYEREAA